MSAKRFGRKLRSSGWRPPTSLSGDLLWCLGMLAMVYGLLIILFASIAGCGDLHIHFDRVTVYCGERTTTQPAADVEDKSIDDLIKERL